jgi:fumarate reductase flavoprotein subunit
MYDIVEKKSCDLVVLGGGGGGMVAAVRAAQLSGKKVIVLEKTPTTGGGAQFARTPRIFGSKWQADHNLPDTTAEYARDMMDLVYWRLDTKLVANTLRGTGQFFDWLCEQGDHIEDLFVVGKYPFEISSGPLVPDLNHKKYGNRFGGFVMDMMKEKCKTYGVEVLTKHPVVDIEVENGKIVAAIAKSVNGYIRIACKACILATGSWISNEEVLKKCCPQFIGMKQWMNPVPHLNPNYTGDGIPIAEKAGALVEYDSFCLRISGPMHFNNFKENKTLIAMSLSPFIITVNLFGKRYCAEPIGGHLAPFEDGHVQIAQPRGLSFDIFDENTLAATFNHPRRTHADIGRPLGNLPETMEEVRSDIEEGFANGDSDIFRAATLGELADRMGVNKENFLETVRKYNESCEKCFDWDFFKSKNTLVPIIKPPYYGFLGRLFTDGAFGGVQVNPEMQVYRPDGSLVEGFYAVGDFVSSRFINLGGVKRQVINDLSWAFSSGFLAGTNTIRYLESLD